MLLSTRPPLEPKSIPSRLCSPFFFFFSFRYSCHVLCLLDVWLTLPRSTLAGCLPSRRNVDCFPEIPLNGTRFFFFFFIREGFAFKAANAPPSLPHPFLPPPLSGSLQPIIPCTSIWWLVSSRVKQPSKCHKCSPAPVPPPTLSPSA